MFCIKCGKQLPDDAAFCYACGAKVWQGEQSNKEENSCLNTETYNVAPVKEITPQKSDKKIEIGNFFVDYDGIYFMVYGYELGTHAQLWKADLDGKNQKCLFDFDTTPYSFYCDAFSIDTGYPMAKIGRRIIFSVSDNHRACNFYYDLDSTKHGIIEDCSFPCYVSVSGKYFYEYSQDNYTNEFSLTLYTPDDIFNNHSGKTFVLNRSTLPSLYSQFDEVIICGSEFYVYNDYQLLIRVILDDKQRFANINLLNMSECKILMDEEFYTPVMNTLLTDGKSALLTSARTSNIACIDLETMTVKSRLNATADVRNSYNSTIHLNDYSSNKNYIFDFRTSSFSELPNDIKVYNGAGINDLHTNASGTYKYSHNSGRTRIYYLSSNELFKPCDPYFDEEDIKPIVGLQYKREFTPKVRIASTDENVYNYNNTTDLFYAYREYIEKTRPDISLKILSSSFFYSKVITLPDGNRIGFTYGHKPEYIGEKDYYYNLYMMDINGNYKYLGCGSRGGIEYLKIYKNYAYWEDMRIYRYDFETGEFIESNEEWLKKEYELVCSKENNGQL